MRVTRAWFREATGLEPIDDDLARANCPHAGSICHQMCGWDTDLNLPAWDHRSVLRRFLRNGDVP